MLSLIVKIPKGFFPQQDTGVLMGGVQGPQDASFPFMDYSLLEMENIIKADPAVEYVNAYTGGGRGATNGGTLFISLKPLSERKADAMEVIDSASSENQPASSRLCLLPAGAGSPHRRPRRQRAVPVHASGGQLQRPRTLGSPSARKHEEYAEFFRT